MARPSQPSGTGTLAVTRPDAVSMTETEGGLNPPLRTRRYLPSGERAGDMGWVWRGFVGVWGKWLDLVGVGRENGFVWFFLVWRGRGLGGRELHAKSSHLP